CGDKNILEGVQHSDDFSKQKRLSFAQRSHSSDSLSSFDLCGINVINPKTDDGVDDISRRRCSTPKSLITPISQSNTNIEYKPVYVNNHRTISIPKSDDEKWQILKHNTSVLNNCNRSSLRNFHNNSNVYCRTTRSHSLLSQSPRICSSRLSLFSGKSFKIDITDTSNDQEVNMNQSMRSTEQENDTVDSTTKSNNIQLNDYGSTSNLSRQDRQNSLKSFFHRIGSTGMLSHKSHNLLKQQSVSEQQSLYRSSSTSQLTNTVSYVKCDDPTEGVTLADDLLHDDCEHISDSSLKSSSCNDLETISVHPETPKKGSFPYAFLRSKLSVLPEENGGSVLKQSLNNLSTASVNREDVSSLCSSSPQNQKKVIYRSSVIKRYSSDDSAISNCSISVNNVCPTQTQIQETSHNSILSKDWEPMYQRLSSCLSSNESGYDSDGGALNLLNPNTKDKRNSLSSMNSTTSTATSNGSGSSIGSNLCNSLHSN
uniref:Uncharacterized protein n=1 Tax=Megaselia scalaris TaxID=36166 RepID=T1GZ22_MEGSC